MSQGKYKNFSKESKVESVRLIEQSGRPAAEMPGNWGFGAISYTNGRNE